MSPRLFDRLLERKDKADKQEWYRTGTIAAAVVNFSMFRPEQMVGPEIFVPGVKVKKAEFDLRKLPPEEQAKYVKAQFAKKFYNRKGKR